MNLAANRFRLGLSRPTFDSIRWHRRCRDFIVPTTSNNLRCQTSQFPHVQIFEYPDGSQGAAQYFNVLKRTFPTASRGLRYLHSYIHHSSRQRETYIPRNKNGTVRLDLSLSGLLFRWISNRSFFDSKKIIMGLL